MKRHFVVLLFLFVVNNTVVGQGNVGVGTTTPQASLHVKKLASSNSFSGVPATMIVEDSGSTVLHIAGNTGSSSDRTGIRLSDNPYSSDIHFYGPNQQLNLGVLGRSQLVVHNNGVLAHDRPLNPAVHPSAAFQVNSFSRGVLLPNLSFDERNAIASPAASLLLYQIDEDPGFYYNAGLFGTTSWKKLITTSDLSPITLLKDQNWVGINKSVPAALLHIRNTDGLDDHIMMEDFFSGGRASMKYLNRHMIFQTTEAFGSFWDFNDHTGTTRIRLQSNGDIDMSGNLTLGPLRKLGVNTDAPSAPAHIVKTAVSGGSFNSRALMILEDNDHGYLQFSNPDNKEAGLLSGNGVTAIRSALLFGIDSSIVIRTGGNNFRAIVTKTGNMGIGTSAPEAKLDVEGTVKLGVGGTPINGIIKTVINADVPTIAANATLAHTFPVPNAAITSAVYVSPKNPLPAGVVIAYARVSVAGTVEVTFLNTTDSNLNPAAMDYAIGVVL